MEWHRCSASTCPESTAVQMGLHLRTPTLLVFSGALRTQQATRSTQLLSFPSSRASEPCTQTGVLCASPTRATQRHQPRSRLPKEAEEQLQRHTCQAQHRAERHALSGRTPHKELVQQPFLKHTRSPPAGRSALGVCSGKRSPEGRQPESTSPVIQGRLWVKDKDL